MFTRVLFLVLSLVGAGSRRAGLGVGDSAGYSLDGGGLVVDRLAESDDLLLGQANAQQELGVGLAHCHMSNWTSRGYHGLVVVGRMNETGGLR